MSTETLAYHEQTKLLREIRALLERVVTVLEAQAAFAAGGVAINSVERNPSLDEAELETLRRLAQEGGGA